MQLVADGFRLSQIAEETFSTKKAVQSRVLRLKKTIRLQNYYTRCYYVIKSKNYQITFCIFKFSQLTSCHKSKITGNFYFRFFV